MKVVSCYEAARVAEVSKQNLSKQKKVNANDKSKYTYFAFDKDSGKFGIDIESKAWLTYMQKRQSTIDHKASMKKTQEQPTQSTLIDHKEGKSVNQDKRFKNLLRAVVFEIKKTSKFSGKEIEKLTDDIWERFEGME